MNRIIRRLALALLSAALLLPFAVSVASAHGHTEVGDYELVIGFKNEPAYQGEPNGLDLTVTNKKTGAKVNDLTDTLKPQWGQDGAYTAYVLPTEAGDYTWHIAGEIEGTPVDLSMTSSPETFGAVQSKASVAFPSAEPTAAELRADLTAATQTARIALLIGGAGVLLGALGIAMALRGRRSTSVPAAQA